MISREELLTSKEYWISKFQIELFDEVHKYLKKNKMTQTDFAKKMGVSKGYISQILNGNFDHKLSKLIEISLFIEKAPVLKFENIKNLISKDLKSKNIDNKPLKARNARKGNFLPSNNIFIK
jgi:transcriptional regulator with XRE-family HTH domain